MNTAYLLLGGNIGDVSQLFLLVIQKISKYGSIGKQSSLYKTKAWGKTDQADFINQVIEFRTKLNPFELLSLALSTEKELGRERKTHWGERNIDIDILFYNHDIVNCHNLVIPHPRLHQRRFTLVPLNEIIPQFQHPLLVKSISDLLNNCKDNLDVVVQ